eukprot:3408649-Pleurochrysis_carterae.AAC.1
MPGPLAGARDDDANRSQHKPDVSIHPNSNLAPIRNQLDAVLSSNLSPAEGTARPEPQSQRILTCAMLSMVLNVAAFFAAIILGARQFWDS